jgi:hypothetical protein
MSVQGAFGKHELEGKVGDSGFVLDVGEHPRRVAATHYGQLIAGCEPATSMAP